MTIEELIKEPDVDYARALNKAFTRAAARLVEVCNTNVCTMGSVLACPFKDKTCDTVSIADWRRHFYNKVIKERRSVMGRIYDEFDKNGHNDPEWFDALRDELCRISVETHKLKPCPWCGEAKKLVTCKTVHECVYVQCGNCFSLIQSKDAVDVWNNFPRKGVEGE